MYLLCHVWRPYRPVSSVHGIFQARILEWVAISSSRGSSQPGDWTCVPCIGRQILYHWATWEAPYVVWLWANESCSKELIHSPSSSKWASLLRKICQTSSSSNSCKQLHYEDLRMLYYIWAPYSEIRWIALLLENCQLFLFLSSYSSIIWNRTTFSHSVLSLPLSVCVSLSFYFSVLTAV